MSEPCPFCHTAIPAGAIVCTGCRAELQRGLSESASKAIGFVGLAVGVGLAIAAQSPFLWVVGFGVIGGVVAVAIGQVMAKGKRTWIRRKQTDARA